ncbi:MAG: hypothetical protein LH472_06630 [Pyrinomonadaceae bacterium]|nr:hypothetical protein [Pyrinomonadaceae bacterium]
MKLKNYARRFSVALLLLAAQTYAGSKLDANEYVGQFDPTLVAYPEDTERIIFKPVSADSLRGAKIPDADVHLTANRLQNPVGASLVAILVEEADAKPMIFVDLNADNSFGEDEKFTFKRQEKDNPYLWVTTVAVPVKNNNLFTACPIFIRYFRDYQTAKMSKNDRLLEQSTQVLARGSVDVKGKKVLVQYAYSLEDKKINPSFGWLGVDADAGAAGQLRRIKRRAIQNRIFSDDFSDCAGRKNSFDEPSGQRRAGFARQGFADDARRNSAEEIGLFFETRRSKPCNLLQDFQ